MYKCIHGNSYECPTCETQKIEDFEWQFKADIRGLGWSFISQYTHPKSPVTLQCENYHVITVIPNKFKKKCPWCIKYPFHKTAKKIFDFLRSIDIPFYTEYSFPWIKKNYRFDFVLPDVKIILELDGSHHFIQVRDYDPPEKCREIDCCKMVYAMSHGYTIIRLYQPDIWEDRLAWKPLLHYMINKRDYPPFTMLTICKEKKQYDEHRECLNQMMLLNTIDISKIEI